MSTAGLAPPYRRRESTARTPASVPPLNLMTSSPPPPPRSRLRSMTSPTRRVHVSRTNIFILYVNDPRRWDSRFHVGKPQSTSACGRDTGPASAFTTVPPLRMSPPARRVWLPHGQSRRRREDDGALLRGGVYAAAQRGEIYGTFLTLEWCGPNRNARDASGRCLRSPEFHGYSVPAMEDVERARHVEGEETEAGEEKNVGAVEPFHSFLCLYGPSQAIGRRWIIVALSQMAHSVLDDSILDFEYLHVFKGRKNLQSGTLPNLAGTIVDGGRLELVNTIGAGAYGRLYKARDVVSSSSSSSSSSSTFYAVKCLKLPGPRAHATHRRVSCHPNVVTLHRHFVDPEHVYLVMDLCTGGDMYGAILDGVYHGQTELIKRTFASLVDAVRFCHSRGVYHRDLKPENVLVDHEGGNPLIADFGLSTESKLSRDNLLARPLRHTTPQHSDAWALCIILVNLVTAMNPWYTAQPSDTRWRAFTADTGSYLREIIPISRPLNELLSRCFRTNPRHRPALGLLQHEILCMDELMMSEADLRNASPGVRRAAGIAVPRAGATAYPYDPSDCSSGSSSGYSSLDASLGRLVNLPEPAGLAPVAAHSHLLTVPVPASRRHRRPQPVPSASKVPFASPADRDLSSEAESDGPITPQAHLVQLPTCPLARMRIRIPTTDTSAGVAIVTVDNVDVIGKPRGKPGKLRRFVRRLRVWRK
ncbi:kinase-like domain-containing protein [Mycena olivaceomarginata]|nr:kinase-like domain-containing protein [Mycena olivaceomarginata]